MRKFLKMPSPAMAVALIALFVGLSGSAAAVTVAYAMNSDKVDGKHAVGYGASLSARKGKLVATSSTNGRLPTNIVRNAGVDFKTIAVTNADVDPAVNVATVTIKAPSAGFVVLHFDGFGSPAASDRLTLAASNVSQDWTPNDGNVTLDVAGSFSHTRVYHVSAGSHTFYAVAHRFIGSGSGLASVYATFTAQFFAARL